MGVGGGVDEGGGREGAWERFRLDEEGGAGGGRSVRSMCWDC